MKKVCEPTTRARAKEQPKEFDFISNLPQAILNSILSRLTLQEVARTSILSKKWRYIWTSIPHLEFSESNALERAPGVLPNLTQQSLIFNKWLALVYRVLLFRRDPIESCRILADFVHDDVLHLDNIITVLIEKRIQRLSLLNTGMYSHNIPSDIFSCLSLTLLELRQWELMKIPASFRCFEHLKFLTLHRITTTDDLIEQLISSCVILEGLIMNECRGISELRIHAPKLFSLGLYTFKPIRGRLWNVPCLEHACIHINDHYPGNIHWEDDAVKLMEFLKQLDHVNSLRLEWYDAFSQYLSRGNMPEHQFCNLKKFSVEVNFNDGNVVHLLSFFLKNSPHLKELQVNQYGWDTPKKLEKAPPDFWKKQNPFECVKSSLERVQIGYGVIFSENGTEFLEFLLMNAAVLKSMTLEHYLYNSRGFLNYLNHLERASPDAELKFVLY